MYISEVKQIFLELTKSFNFSRAALSFSGSDWLFVWAVNYLPFNYPEKTFSIDSYYLVSHKTHLQKKMLAGLLQEKGILAESFKGDLKQTASDLKLGTFLKNRLVCVNETSYCCLAAVCGKLNEQTDHSVGLNESCQQENDIPSGAETGKMRFDEILQFGEINQKTCLSCNKCVNACPSGALTLDGWEREKCLRQVQENGGGPQLTNSSQFLGCDLCQRACPLNSLIKSETPPKDLLQFLKKEELEENLNDLQKLNSLAQLIGTNYARKSKLLSILKWLLEKSADDGANCKKQR